MRKNKAGTWDAHRKFDKQSIYREVQKARAAEAMKKKEQPEPPPEADRGLTA